MINLVIGAAIVALIYYGLKAFGRADAKALATLGRRAGGGALLLVAAFLGARGHIETALPLGIFGLSLIGWDIRGAMPWSRGSASRGRTSNVRTAALDMMLDHDSGRLDRDGDERGACRRVAGRARRADAGAAGAGCRRGKPAATRSLS